MLTRIMGENGESFRPGTLSISIGGGHGAVRQAEIGKRCDALGQLASGLLESKNFTVALVTYRAKRCHVYGTGLGDDFPTGSKIELADLAFEAVDGRFDSFCSDPRNIADFDNALRGQMRGATSRFRTDIDFFD